MRRKFCLSQSSLEVIKTVFYNNPEAIAARFITHPVTINWRQLHQSGEKKIQNIETGLIHLKPTDEILITRKDLLKTELEDFSTPETGQVWSFTSKVPCKEGLWKHVPMMNFHPEEGTNLSDLEESILKICPGKRGVLLESGRYYHYYGDYLLSEEDWIKFLSSFLMPCVVVSPRYIGHALNDGYCSLRITRDNRYKPKIPRVIKIFEEV